MNTTLMIAQHRNKIERKEGRKGVTIKVNKQTTKKIFTRLTTVEKTHVKPIRSHHIWVSHTNSRT